MIQQTSNPKDSIVDRLIASQQQLTAVEKFSQRHQSITAPANESFYQDLIPISAPEEGEQYSFEIDLDACSGCKACVAACHSLNGLDEGEIWRNVGLLTGGDDFNPVVQHVTSACHHCLDPGCMSGCPVRAYEKDPVTGIVEHLDDQCIGCKYCMFTCPYDVPSYSKSKGIVRKCNMCVDRLRVGEAPACVQACPHEAIKIRKVEVETVRNDVAGDNGSARSLLPGAPPSRLTMPTTRYLSASGIETKGLPVDFYSPKSQHAHFPLVFMLVLTQMSLGIFLMTMLFALGETVSRSMLTGLNAFGFATLCAGLGVAALHLGRPTKAYRAMSGFRTSWLSREIIGFNAYAGAASSLLVACLWLGSQIGLLSVATVAAGILAVECSVMLYVVTGRPLWSAARTHVLFFLSALVSGSAAVLLALNFNGLASPVAAVLMIAGLGAKLYFETRLLSHLSLEETTPEKLSARLLVGEQRTPSMVRLILAAIGMTIGLMLLFSSSLTLAALCFACVLGGELLERYLFFSVCVARRMPGAPN